MPHLQNVARAEGHRHDVEAAAHTVEAARLQIMLGEAGEPALLVPGDCRGGSVAPRRPPAFDLDEHDDTGVAADEVDLALAEAHVAIGHGEPGPLEETRGGVFRSSSQCPPRIAHAPDIAHRPAHRKSAPNDTPAAARSLRGATLRRCAPNTKGASGKWGAVRRPDAEGRHGFAGAREHQGGQGEMGGRAAPGC